MKQTAGVQIGLALLIGSASAAQGNTLGLSDADYDLLIAAKSAAVSSFAQEFCTDFRHTSLKNYVGCIQNLLTFLVIDQI